MNELILPPQELLGTALNYAEALREMHKGNVVKYVGTVNGHITPSKESKFCMCRGCVFLYAGGINWDKIGCMVYDPDFRYMLTGEVVDTNDWG
jgi:hypothetical protein